MSEDEVSKITLANPYLAPSNVSLTYSTGVEWSAETTYVTYQKPHQVVWAASKGLTLKCKALPQERRGEEGESPKQMRIHSVHSWMWRNMGSVCVTSASELAIELVT